jgi:hypothetical protein
MSLSNLDCPFFIALAVFSKVYFNNISVISLQLFGVRVVVFNAIFNNKSVLIINL